METTPLSRLRRLLGDVSLIVWFVSGAVASVVAVIALFDQAPIYIAILIFTVEYAFVLATIEIIFSQESRFLKCVYGSIPVLLGVITWVAAMDFVDKHRVDESISHARQLHADGFPEQSIEAWHTAVKIAETNDLDERAMKASCGLGAAKLRAYSSGKGDSEADLKRCLSAADRRDDLFFQIEASFWLGRNALYRDRRQLSRLYFTRADSLVRVYAEQKEQDPDRTVLAPLLLEQAKASRESGDYMRADSLSRRAAIVFQDLGRIERQAGALITRGQVALDRARRTGAAALRQADRARADSLATEGLNYCRRARNLARKVGSSKEANTLACMGNAYYIVGRLSAARDDLQLAKTSYQEMSAPLGIANVLDRLAKIDVAQDRPELARRRYLEADSIYRELGQNFGRYGVLLGQARLDAESGDFGSARSRMSEALTIAQRLGPPRAPIQAMIILGELAAAEGDTAAACQWWRRALAASSNQAEMGKLKHIASAIMQSVGGCGRL